MRIHASELDSVWFRRRVTDMRLWCSRQSALVEHRELLRKTRDCVKPQMFHQTSEPRDCGVFVFAALAGVSEDEIRRDLPEAHLGEVSVDGWISWLEEKGFTVLPRRGCPDDIVPCAHLVALNELRDGAHWIYRDREGDVHDPNSAQRYVQADDPRMKSLSFYSEKVLTISV